MNRHLTKVLLGLVIMVSAAAIGHAQAAAPRGTVKGTVTDASGPVVSAKVVINSAASSYTVTATTDQKGDYTFLDVPVGGVEVKVYDAQENMRVSRKGNIKFEGDVIIIDLRFP